MTEPRKRRDRYELDDEGNPVLELEPIDIRADPARYAEPTIELEPIDIVGSVSGRVEAKPNVTRAGRHRGDGVSQLLPDWVSPDVTTFTGQPVEDPRTGLTGYEIPAWAAWVLADSDGDMPDTPQEAAWAIARHYLAPGAATAYNALMGVPTTAEERTFEPLSAIQAASQVGSLGLADDFVGLFDPEMGRDMESASEWAGRENPGSTLVGEQLATLGQMFVPGASAGRGATVGRAALAGGLEGAAFGGVEGFGRSTADTLGGRLQDAAPGAVLGGVLGGAMGGGARRMQERSELPVDEAAAARLMSDANIEWASQAGAAQSRKRMRQLLGGNAERQIENADFVGSQMRDLGVTEPRRIGPIELPPSEQMMQERFAEAGTRANQRIRETLARMDNEAPVDLSTMLDPLRERLALLDRTPGGSPAAAQLRQRIGEFERLGTPIINEDGVLVGHEPPVLSFSELQRMKRFLYNNTGLDVNVEGERTRVYEALRDRMQGAVDDVDPDLGAAYRQARRTSSTSRRMEQMGSDSRLQDAVNRRTSPSDYMAMAMGLGGPMGLITNAMTDSGGATGVAAIGGAVAAGVANRAWRSNEHGVRAMSLERQAERLRTNPERFGRWARRLQAAQSRGPRAFAAALYSAAQSDEDVRAALAEEDAADQANAEAGGYSREPNARQRTAAEEAELPMLEAGDMDAFFSGDIVDVPEGATDADFDELFGGTQQ